MTAGCVGPTEAVVTLVLDCGRAVRGTGIPQQVRTRAAPLPRRRAGPTGRLDNVLEHFDGELQHLWEGQSVAA